MAQEASSEIEPIMMVPSIDLGWFSVHVRNTSLAVAVRDLRRGQRRTRFSRVELLCTHGVDQVGLGSLSGRQITPRKRHTGERRQRSDERERVGRVDAVELALQKARKPERQERPEDQAGHH